MKLDRVLITIDFSERSIAAARWVARSFAPASEVVLVHVLPVPRAPRFVRGSYAVADETLDRWRNEARLQLRQLGQQISRGIVFEEVRTGRADEQIEAVAKEYHADLVVVGSHRDRAGLWNRLGGTAEQILTASSVPVLVVHGTPQAPPRLLLAAVDDSAAASAVIEHARGLVHRFHARGKLAHVLSERLIQRLLATGEVIAHEVPMIQAEQNLVVETYEWLTKQTQGLRDSLEPAVMLGDAAESILKEASRAGTDLLILGHDSNTEARRSPLGSVSGAVLRGAKCPVLLIPPEEVTDPIRSRAERGCAEPRVALLPR